MNTLLLGSFALSLFHALIPSHWLPIVAIGHQSGWTIRQTLGVTFVVGLAHVLSTLFIGLLLALAGGWLAHEVEVFAHWVAPALLVGLGAFYLYQHYHHHHFHLHPQRTRWGVVGTLAAAMFFSPCLEIEGYFLAAGKYGWEFVGLLALMYSTVTLVGMLTWVWLALHGLKRLDWHAWEHSAGLITGLTLIVSGAALLLLE